MIVSLLKMSIPVELGISESASNQVELSRKGELGLANLGNTCYLNSVLQCLRHCADLTLFFNKHSDEWIHKAPDKDANLCRAYKDLVEGLWKGSPPGYMKPTGFLHFFRQALKDTAVDHMIAPIAHDSHEALVFLLDQLHEGMKREFKIEVTAPSDSPVYGALIAWKEQIGPQYSPIVDYFFGLMQVNVICKRCNKTSRRYETFNMLKTQFPDFKAATLNECIDHEFQDEQIDEYSCDTCEANLEEGKPKRPDAYIRRRIWRLPRNFIVLAKRFNPNGTKCHAKLETTPTNTFAQWFAEDSPESSRSSTYELQSIIDHHGSSNGGHYTAQVKSPITKKWNQYDDEGVSQIMDGSKPIIGQTTYILFYRRA